MDLRHATSCSARAALTRSCWAGESGPRSLVARLLLLPLLWCGLLLGNACARTSCERCETLVIAATGEPSALLPPLVGETVGRDVGDLIFEHLAVLPGGASPLDSSAYHPGLAVRWERVDSLTLRFHLRSGARWHDSVRVSAADVAFSFAAYADSALEAQSRDALAGRVSATAQDDSTALIHFTRPDPEQWYDATWHVRILPSHVWSRVPTAQWSADTSTAHLIGSGPFRLRQWIKGQSLTLERADDRKAGAIRRVVWRFAGDPDAALNLLLSHEADLMEAVGDSARVARVASDSQLTTRSYPSAVYGFLGFNLGAGARARAPALRRALAQALDRAAVARAALGAGAVAPPGPMSRVLWIYDDSIRVPAYDSAAAAQALRQHAGLSLDILVPATSSARRNLAQVIQEMWRRVGVRTSVTSVDFPVFQQRLRTGKFDSFVGAWLDEPSPRGLGPQWTTGGIGVLNYCHYSNPAFDSLFRRAAELRGTPPLVRAAWREALDTLNADMPAIWLYTPTNVAGASRRIAGLSIDPYSWLATLPSWSLNGRR